LIHSNSYNRKKRREACLLKAIDTWHIANTKIVSKKEKKKRNEDIENRQNHLCSSHIRWWHYDYINTTWIRYVLEIAEWAKRVRSIRVWIVHISFLVHKGTACPTCCPIYWTELKHSYIDLLLSLLMLFTFIARARV
jgi:hypothetical protein